jgi:hypothetical protein
VDMSTNAVRTQVRNLGSAGHLPGNNEDRISPYMRAEEPKQILWLESMNKPGFLSQTTSSHYYPLLKYPST